MRQPIVNSVLKYIRQKETIQTGKKKIKIVKYNYSVLNALKIGHVYTNNNPPAIHIKGSHCYGCLTTGHCSEG